LNYGQSYFETKAKSLIDYLKKSEAEITFQLSNLTTFQRALGRRVAGL
jgi:hypothetical protein